MILVFFSVHIASSNRSLDVSEKFIKRRLGAADGFKSQWPRDAIGFFSPAGIIPAVGVDSLDFVSHDLFKAQTGRAGKFGLANITKPGQVYLQDYESASFLHFH
jgi:hypothetical protein